MSLGGHVPDTDAAVPTASGQAPAVRRESDRSDLVRVPVQGLPAGVLTERPEEAPLFRPFNDRCKDTERWQNPNSERSASAAVAAQSFTTLTKTRSSARSARRSLSWSHRYRRAGLK